MPKNSLFGGPKGRPRDQKGLLGYIHKKGSSAGTSTSFGKGAGKSHSSTTHAKQLVPSKRKTVEVVDLCSTDEEEVQELDEIDDDALEKELDEYFAQRDRYRMSSQHRVITAGASAPVASSKGKEKEK